MNLTVNQISFQARIIIQPKTNKVAIGTASEKVTYSNSQNKLRGLMSLLTKIIKHKLSVKIKNPS